MTDRKGQLAAGFKSLGVIASLALILQGCSKMQESFLTVQTCLVDQAGVIQFKSMMRSVAKVEDLKYIDNSAHQGASLKTMEADKLLKRDAALAIDVHIEGPGGMGVTAGNLGLPPYQVALGFTEGSDAAKAHRLSDRLVQALSQRWRVETVPQGKGALPMKTCGG
jgi:hypothetical protein